MNALVLREPNKEAQAQGQRHGLAVSVADGWELPATKTLFAAPTAEIPWQLLEAGWGFLDKWDLAAPLWRYGVLAQDIGGPSEQTRTKTICKDLRHLLYAHELLFVRDSVDARHFLHVWRQECVSDAEPRLAFLRALHIVKPLFCALPRSWLQEVAAPVPERPKPPRRPSTMVQVELAPGRYVCCKPGEEEMYRKRFEQMRRKRGRG